MLDWSKLEQANIKPILQKKSSADLLFHPWSRHLAPNYWINIPQLDTNTSKGCSSFAKQINLSVPTPLPSGFPSLLCPPAILFTLSVVPNEGLMFQFFCKRSFLVGFLLSNQHRLGVTSLGSHSERALFWFFAAERRLTGYSVRKPFL